MGYPNVMRGEYVVRVRLDVVIDPPAPPIAWEDARHPRLALLCDTVPAAAIAAARPVMERVRALNDWVACLWPFRDASSSPVYTPWDAATVISWASAAEGAYGQPPVVLCVHWAVTLVTACLATGPAYRPAAPC
jgi:hypothetical protein